MRCDTCAKPSCDCSDCGIGRRMMALAGFPESQVDRLCKACGIVVTMSTRGAGHEVTGVRV